MNVRYTLSSQRLDRNLCRVRLRVGCWLPSSNLLPGEIVLEHGQWSREEYLNHHANGFIPVYENAQASWFGTADYYAGYHNPSNSKFDRHIIGRLKEKRPYYWEVITCVK